MESSSRSEEGTNKSVARSQIDCKRRKLSLWILTPTLSLSFSSPSRLKHHKPKSAGACSNPSWSLQAVHVLLIGFIKRIPVLSTSLSLRAACSSTRPITTSYLESTRIWEGSRRAFPVLPEESEKCYLGVSGDATRVGVKRSGALIV